MGLKTTVEVIGGVHVTRFNGNNPKGGRQTGRAEVSRGLRRAPSWVKAKARAQATRKAKEAEYERRYLGG